MLSRVIIPIDPEFPHCLTTISGPPGQLYVAGAKLNNILNGRKAVAIVGSRRVSPYGRQVTLQFARMLAEQGIVIISGLALGVDALAHQAALEVGGLTIAVMPSSLTNLYPQSNAWLARKIIQQGGALLSEYGPGESISYKSNFVARNRLIAGLADATLVTEAAERSGSLHTAAFALDSSREVLAVPGNITSPLSAGANALIRAGKAGLALSSSDVLHVLGLSTRQQVIAKGTNTQEQIVLDLVAAGEQNGEALLAGSQLPISLFNQTLTMLEISGKLRPLGGNQWSLA